MNRPVLNANICTFFLITNKPIIPKSNGLKKAKNTEICNYGRG